MSDDSHRLRARLVLAALVAALLFAGGGFYAGRTTTPEEPAAAPTQDACASTRALARKAAEEAERLSSLDPPQTASAGEDRERMMTLVEQNPACFDPAVRAEVEMARKRDREIHDLYVR